MPVQAIIHAKLIMVDRLIPDGTIVISADRIVACGAADEVQIPEGATCFDAQGLYVGPGFIDIHCHGGGNVWSFEDPLTFAQAHLQYGTTGILPTPVYIQTREAFRDGLKRIVDAIASQAPWSSLLLGMHLEGPFLNPKYGAQRLNIRAVDPEEYREILAIAGPYIKVWTIAPEQSGTFDMLKEASGFEQIVYSVGHSESDAETIYACIPYGLRLACHLMDASGASHAPSRLGGTREVGVDEAALVHDDIFVEVIPDRCGAHVRPLMLKLILKTKGIDQVIVITDAMPEAATGVKAIPPDFPHLADFQGSDDVNYTADGQLNGSILTMDRAVYNMMRHTGADMVSAFRMGSLNAARLLGLDHEMGSIAVGKKANLIVVTESIKVQAVWFEGQSIPLTHQQN